MSGPPVKVFLVIRPFKRAVGASLVRTASVCAEWLTFRNRTVMYRSKPCGKRTEAEALARKWLARNPDFVDTTKELTP